MVFGLFKKIMSLLLSGLCVKSKFLWFINIVRRFHAWEKSISQVKAKMALRERDISIVKSSVFH